MSSPRRGPAGWGQPALPHGSWGASTALMPCIGTMNLERAGRCSQQGAADVSSAELFSDSSAGKMPAAPCDSWNASIHFRACIGTMNRWPSRARRKAPINRTHSRRFAPFGDARQSRSVWSACVFSAAFPRQAAIRWPGCSWKRAALCEDAPLHGSASLAKQAKTGSKIFARKKNPFRLVMGRVKAVNNQAFR